MSYFVTIELIDGAFARLQKQALAVSRTPVELATAALERQFGPSEAPKQGTLPTTEAERQAARDRFERHFGAVNLGHPTGADNEQIDADLAREYEDARQRG